MGWDYSDTDCENAKVCSFSPRCTVKHEGGCQHYIRKEKSFIGELFDKVITKIIAKG